MLPLAYLGKADADLPGSSKGPNTALAQTYHSNACHGSRLSVRVSSMFYCTLSNKAPLTKTGSASTAGVVILTTFDATRATAMAVIFHSSLA